MFTRYKDFSVPQNYSGVRFKAPPETETKLHKPTQLYTGTKTSVSPIFNEILEQKTKESYQSGEGTMVDDTTYNDEYVESYDNEEYVESYDNEIKADEENAPLSEEKTVSKENEEAKSSSLGKLGEISSSIGKLLGGLSSENILILGVILLLLDNQSEENLNLILPLVCLLLYN